MAKKPNSDKPAGESKLPSIMRLLAKLCSVLAGVALLVLFAASIDFGFLNLTGALSEFAVVPFAVLAVCLLLGALLNMKIAASDRELAEDVCSQLAQQVEAKLSAVDERINGYLGAEFSRLKEENEAMKARLTEIEELEAKSLASENEALKQEITELKTKLEVTRAEASDAGSSSDRTAVLQNSGGVAA